MTIDQIRDPSQVAAMHAALPRLADHPGAVTRWQHRRRNGELFDVEVSSDAITFDGRRARLVMAHEITSRTRAEAGQASAVRALRLLGAANAAMIRIDDEERLLDEICRIVVDIGGFALAGVGYCQHDDDRTLKPMAAAGTPPPTSVMNSRRFSVGVIRSPRRRGRAASAARRRTARRAPT